MSDAALKYVVELEIVRTGDAAGAAGVRGLAGETDKATSAAKTLANAYLDVGKSIYGAFDSGMTAIGSYGAMAATAGFGILTHQALQLNSSLETTQMSLAAIFNAGGAVPDIGAGVDKAGKVMAQMRRDAAELPGTFQDLVGIMRTIGTSGLQKGLSIEDLQSTSRKAMAAGAAMGMNQAMVGRELSQLLEGRSGSHNVFGTRLGITGDDSAKFNRMEGGDRVKEINKKLGRYDGAVEAFKGTWDAISSSAADNAKQFLGDSTSAVFERIKEAGKEFNKWFSANESQILKWANVIGTHLAEAFYQGKVVVQTYWPLFANFAESAYHKGMAIFKEWGPTIQKVGGHLADMLKDPDGTLDKLILLAKLYVGSKLVGGAASIGSSLLGPILSAGAKVGTTAFFTPLGGLLGAGGAAAGAEGAAAGAAGAAGAGGLAASAAGAAASLALVATSAFAIYELSELYTVHGQAVKESTENEWAQARNIVFAMQGWDEVKTAGINSTMFSEAVADAQKNVSLFDDVIWGAQKALESITGAITGGEFVYDAGASPEDAIRQRYEAEQRRRELMGAATDVASDALKMINYGVMNANKEEDKKKKKAPEATTNIVIHQTISGNNAPGQVARRAIDLIVKELSSGKVSRHAPNFSAKTRT